MTEDTVLNFWNDRAKLQEKAGSNDIHGKNLETKVLLSYIRDGMEIAEFGCGNGLLAMEIIKNFDVSISAFDYSSEMISAARKLQHEKRLNDKPLHFEQFDVRHDFRWDQQFDLILTERMLINLKSWEEQARAIIKMARHLKASGKLVLCESSLNGLNEINRLRSVVELEAIQPPWHNRYLVDEEVQALDVPECRLVEVVPFTASYHFLSRVVNAWLAKRENLAPSYDAPVNLLGTLLPPVGTCSQGKLWVWERHPSSK
jgi:ubiquinone/menaquinone biosynthesis C-methylase UbiE